MCTCYTHNKANKINEIDLWMLISDTEEKFPTESQKSENRNEIRTQNAKA